MGQFQRFVVHQAEKMGPFQRLFANRFDDIRISMAQDKRAGAADIINPPVAVGSLHPRALAFANNEIDLFRQSVLGHSPAGENLMQRLFGRRALHYHCVYFFSL